MAVVHVNSLQMSIEAKFFVMHITFVHVSSIILGLDFGSYATTCQSLLVRTIYMVWFLIDSLWLYFSL